MKNFLAIIVLFAFIDLNAQNNAWIEAYTSNWENYDGGTKLIANNDNWLPITFVLNYHPINLEANKPNGTYVVVPPRTKGYEVVRFDKINKSKGWKFKKGNTRTYLGDLTDTEFDETYLLRPISLLKSVKAIMEIYLIRINLH